MKKTVLLLLCAFMSCLIVSKAQPPQQRKDSLALDSSGIYQLQMTQDYQQQKIDSLIKIRITKELENTANSSEKIKELEEQLQKLTSADSLRKVEQFKKIEAIKKTTAGVPVAPFGDTIFNIYLRLGSFKPAERASGISARIQEVYEDNFFKPDSLVILQNDIGYEIDYKEGYTIMNISELDALWYGKTAKEVAENFRDKIKQAIAEERKKNSVLNIARKVGMIVMIIIGAFFLVYLINRLYHFLGSLLTRNKNKIFKGITLGKQKIFSPDYEERVAHQVLNFVRILSMIIGLYLCLPLLFYVFPATQDITNTLLDWIITPAKNILHGIINFLPDLFTIAVIYLFTSWVIKAFKYFATEIQFGRMNISGFHRDFARPTFNILRFILYAFMLVLIFPYLPGSSSPAFQGVSVFLGILISLGSTSAINNIIAGMVITYMRPFKIGDRVRIGDTIGDVIEKSMLVIKIKTIKNEEITVPNSMVLSSNTVNYSSYDETTGVILHTTVTIGYSVPWKNMHEALIKAALRTKYILQVPKPFVLQTALNDFYVSYEINAYTKDSNEMANIYSDLHQNIQDCCNEAGIEIMSPHYSNLRDGNHTTIPESYLPKDYKAPSFNMQQEEKNV